MTNSCMTHMDQFQGMPQNNISKCSIDLLNFNIISQLGGGGGDFSKLFIVCEINYCRYYIGQQANIQIADLDILKQILVKDFDNFSDHSVS